MKNRVWLIGSGSMSLDYAKVLLSQQIDFCIIGRGDRSAAEFEQKTGLGVNRGGLSKFLGTKPEVPEKAIVAVGVEELKNVSVQLIQYGVKHLLVEKPAGLNGQEIEELKHTAAHHAASVYVAYNRRFYSSVIKARKIIQEDGGVTSFNFEFTEWSHIIETLKKGPGVMQHWFLGNSTHVVDLAFYLGGRPKQISCYTSGALPWHPAASAFAGAGVSENGALFCYQANWAAPGRWSVEILTKQHRLILRPLEKLQIQNIGEVSTTFVDIDDRLDIDYKPGLYREVQQFMRATAEDFCDIKEQSSFFAVYNQMAGYGQ